MFIAVETGHGLVFDKLGFELEVRPDASISNFAFSFPLLAAFASGKVAWRHTQKDQANRKLVSGQPDLDKPVRAN
ncbi:hypothetical protein BH10ACI2_BH10ACI2_23670 [soil metagenome]